MGQVPSSSAGYSGTPLARKLGLKNGQRVWRHAMPETVAAEIAEAGLGCDLLDAPSAPLDLGHVFVTERAELAALLGQLRPVLAPNGAIWVSWPKRAARVATDISEQDIRDLALPLNLVDIKVCAIDAVWSGLKLVLRRAARTQG